MSRAPRSRPPADDRGGLGDVGTGSGVGGAGELTADELAAMRADDALLDALGRGEPVAGDDELAEMLGAWRAEMDTEPLPAIDVTAVAADPGLDVSPFRWDTDAEVADATGAVAASGSVAASGRAKVRPATTSRPAGGPGGGAHPVDGRPGRSRSRRWPLGVRVGLALLLVVAAVAGLSITAERGGPDGPLWTVVRLVDPAGADLREAQDAVAKAEKAFAEGRDGDTRTLIDKAQPLVDKVRDPAQRASLQARLDALRKVLTATAAPRPPEVPGTGSTSGGPTPTRNPGNPGGTPGAAGGGGPTVTPTPGQTGGVLGGLLPSSPAPLLPTCVLSLPPVHIPPLPPLC